MCCICFPPTDPFSVNPYPTAEHRHSHDSRSQQTTNAFCSILPLIVTTACTLAFLLTGHPLALFGAVMGAVWTIFAISEEESSERAQHIHHHVTQRYIPSPSVTIIHQQPRPQTVFMTQPPSNTYTPPPSDTYAPPSYSPFNLQTPSQPLNFNPFAQQPKDATDTRAPVGRRYSSTVQNPNIPTPIQNQQRAPVRDLSNQNTPRVELVEEPIILSNTQQDQTRAPVGRREEPTETSVSTTGRARVGRRGGGDTT